MAASEQEMYAMFLLDGTPGPTFPSWASGAKPAVRIYVTAMCFIDGCVVMVILGNEREILSTSILGNRQKLQYW